MTTTFKPCGCNKKIYKNCSEFSGNFFIGVLMSDKSPRGTI